MSVVSEPVLYAPSEPIAPASPARTRLTHSLLAAGLLLVAAGAYLPWLVVYNGLTPIPGFRLGGAAPAGVVLGAAGLVLVALHRGGGRVLRPVAAVATVAVAGYVLYIAHGVLGYVADPGELGLLLMPRAGFGAYVMAAGAVCVLTAALVARPTSRPLPRLMWLQLAAAALSFGAGWVHLMLAPEHLDEHPILGVGFVLAGVAQVGLAVLVVARPNLTTLPLLVVLNVAIMAVYSYAVLVGLPFGDAGDTDMAGMAGMADMDHDHGLMLGAGEPVDVVGAATFAAELLGLSLVVALIRRVARR